MKLYPEYSNNIIVYVISNNVGQWYVTEKELWFLDRVAFAKAFNAEPTPEDIDFVKELCKGNGTRLLIEINNYQVKTEELRELIEVYPPLRDDESVLEMMPSLYIDIDQKVLKNLFPEPSGIFEKYAPAGWNAEYSDFCGNIKGEHSYWLNNGKNHFEQIT